MCVCIYNHVYIHIHISSKVSSTQPEIIKVSIPYSMIRLCVRFFSDIFGFYLLIFIGVQLLYDVVFLLYSKVNQLYVYIYPLFLWISFSFRSRQNIEQSSLSYTVGSHQSSILYIVSVVYVCQFQSPNSFHSTLSPWVPISLFSLSVSLFLLCK